MKHWLFAHTMGYQRLQYFACTPYTQCIIPIWVLNISNENLLDERKQNIFKQHKLYKNDDKNATLESGVFSPFCEMQLPVMAW